MKHSPIVIVGGGSIGKRHINNLKHLGFKGLYCLKRKQNDAFEQEIGAKVITSYAALISLKPLAVFVCNPTSLHLESMEAAIKAGAHIFMEKPLIHNEQGYIEALQLLKNYDKVFFIGFMLRYHKMVLQLKDLLDQGIIGTVYASRFVFGSHLPFWHPWEDYKTSYASRAALGGGVVNTITHEMDLIQFFFGMPKSVYCQKSNFGLLDIEVEEQAEFIFEFEDHVTTLHLDYLQKDYERNIVVYGKEGKIFWDWNNNVISVKKHGEDLRQFAHDATFDVNQLYIDEIADFFSKIEEGTSVHGLDKNHALENTWLLLKSHESAKMNKKITV